MKKTIAKIVAMVLVVATMATCLVACGKKDDGVINIGASGPLTGDAAVYGKAVYNSAMLAVEEINAAGGLNGVPFKFDMYDDQHKPELVQTGFADLLENKGMQVSLGCVTTNPCLEFAPLCAENDVFFLTPSASGDDVPSAGEGYGYQMCFADGNQGKVAAEYVNSLGLTKIGIFYLVDDPYSKGIYDNFKENLSSSITTVEQTFTKNTATDFTAQVDALKDCDFIFMPIYYTPASLFMTQAVGKVADDATYYGCDGFDGIESAFDISTVPQKITMLSHFNSKATDGAAKTFVDKYVAKYGKDTLNQFGAAAYDCVYAIYNALKASGEKITGATSAADISVILKAQFDGGFTYSGVTGADIKWESTGYVNKAAVAYVIKEAN